MTRNVDALPVKIFGDGADIGAIRNLRVNPLIKGFTTNPTLMRAAGVADYEAFAHEVLDVVPDLPVSFEVFADDLDEMVEQGFHIGSWGENVYVKIPVVNTRGEFTGSVVERLSASGVRVNVTAVFTLQQVEAVAAALSKDVPAYVSIFAGRIADCGIDPVPLVESARHLLASLPLAELIWASPRELYNIFHAADAGCHIITVTPDLLAKLSLVGKDQEQYSLETSQMFHRDAQTAGYSINVPAQRNAVG